MTVVSTILDRAKDYPDRIALVTHEGLKVPYGELGLWLEDRTHYHHRTSGTTGTSKRFVITDDNLRRRLVRLELSRPPIVPIMSLLCPVSEGVPLGTLLRTHMYLKGGTVFEMHYNGLDPTIAMCCEHNVEAISIIPKLPMVRAFADEARGHRFSLALVSGAPATDLLFDKVYAHLADDIHFAYAVSEAGPISGGDIAEIGDIPGCVGHICKGVDLEILDDGQVRIRCDTIADGYYDDKELTAKKFRDGWLYPGDLAHFEKGMLCIDGRV